MNSEILKALSKDDLVTLILAQQVQIEAQAVQIGALTARIAELEARLNMPRKTPGNSSTPPSKGQKPNRPARPKQPRRGRPGVTRALAAHPDHVIEATLATCPHCEHALGLADQPDIHAYDHIDLPPISPVVGSDETSARVRGKTWWQWVLLSSTAICHVIADTRAASVVTTFLRYHVATATTAMFRGAGSSGYHPEP